MILHSMGALLWILSYGVAAALVGLGLARREHKEREARQTADEQYKRLFTALRQVEHALLTTDAGEQVEVFLAKGPGRG
jgi:hypothetical protein